MDTDKPTPVGNILPLRFVGGPTIQGRIGRLQLAWELKILVAVVMAVGIPTEEALSDTGMNTSRALINL